jgi:hypothetical protein
MSYFEGCKRASSPMRFCPIRAWEIISARHMARRISSVEFLAQRLGEDGADEEEGGEYAL